MLRLPLELRDGKATALRISLPPHFPQERPSLSVLLPVVHPAVDSTGRLRTPGLNGWVYGQSMLADVVGEAVATLTSAVVDARQPGGAAGASIHRSKARAYVADALPSKTCLQIAVTSVRKAAYSAILPLCPWSQASRTRLATLRQQGACLPLGAPARV